VALPAFTKTQSGLYYLDLQPGTGPEAVAGRQVTVHYTGWLPDGEKFDSSVTGESRTRSGSVPAR
jgi:FKBP-type peptidyl-prolyl cis-trans isomerase